MLDAWIPITVGAAFFQTVRTGAQRQLKSRLNTNSITFVRFAYGVPFAVAFYLVARHVGTEPAPVPSARFLAMVGAAGLSQIAATYLLVLLFSFRNFAVGTTYSKTEAVQTAILGALLFGATLTGIAFLGIVISVAGVLAMSMVRDGSGWRGVLMGWTERTALIGLASGACFSLATLLIRDASLSLPSGDFSLRAATVLVCMTTMQTAVMAVWIALRQREEIPRLIAAWRPSVFVGLTSVAGSACWAMAFTLQNVAYVRALGQVELVFSLLMSTLVFRERSRRAELAGIALMIVGIVIMMLGK